MIRITKYISIDESELQIQFIRASGPGGQHVNKVSSAVQLRFDILHSPHLRDDVRVRLIRLSGRRMSAEGVLVIKAQRYRKQERNRQDAIDRLVTLIRRAAEKPKRRIKTKPPRSSRERRLKDKRIQSDLKRLRHPPS